MLAWFIVVVHLNRDGLYGAHFVLPVDPEYCAEFFVAVHLYMVKEELGTTQIIKSLTIL